MFEEDLERCFICQQPCKGRVHSAMNSLQSSVSGYTAHRNADPRTKVARLQQQRLLAWHAYGSLLSSQRHSHSYTDHLGLIPPQGNQYTYLLVVLSHLHPRRPPLHIFNRHAHVHGQAWTHIKRNPVTLPRKHFEANGYLLDASIQSPS